MPRCALLGERFSASYHFKLLTPKFTEATEKSVFFWRKAPLNGKFSKFRYERIIHRHMNSRIPAEIDKAELTKPAWYSFVTKKGWYFAPFSVASGAISPKIYRITLSPFSIALPSFVQIRPVFDEMYPKIPSKLITIN